METKTRTGTTRHVYRCRTCEKGRKAAGEKRPIVARAVDVPFTQQQERYFMVPGVRESENVRWREPREEHHDAPTCDAGHPMRYHATVRGRRVESIKCDARCEGATGANCECSCGGKNHGKSHL